jgi:VWFA-related protein
VIDIAATYGFAIHRSRITITALSMRGVCAVETPGREKVERRDQMRPDSRSIVVLCDEKPGGFGPPIPLSQQGAFLPRRLLGRSLPVLVLSIALWPVCPVFGQYVEQVDVSVANVEVVVTDRQGNPVRGLTIEDFELFENGVRQTITNFAVIDSASVAESIPSDAAAPTIVPDPQRPRLIVLFLDIDDIDRFERDRFFKGLRDFFVSAFREGDFATILTWNHRLRVVVPPTSSQRQLFAAIDIFAESNRGSEIERMRRAAEIRLQQAESDAAFAQSIGMMPGLDMAAEKAFVEWVQGEERCANIRRKARELRNLITSFARIEMQKILIFASDDMSLQPSGDCSTRSELDALSDTANAYGITVHALHPPGVRKRMIGADRGGFIPRPRDPSPVAVEYDRTFDQSGGLLHLAKQTGGLVALGPVQSDRALQRAANELETHYSIGYRLSPGDEDRPRRIKVTTRDRRLNVRARSSVMRLSEAARLRDLVTTNLYLPSATASRSPAFDVAIERITRDGRNLLVHIELLIRPADLLLLRTEDGKQRGSFSVFVAAGREVGDASEVSEMKQELEISSNGDAFPETITYSFATRIRPDTARLSIAVRDDLSGDTATTLVTLPR